MSYRSQVQQYLAARQRETCEAQAIVENLKRSIDQGCGLGFDHLAGYAGEFDHEEAILPEPTRPRRIRTGQGKPGRKPTKALWVSAGNSGFKAIKKITFNPAKLSVLHQPRDNRLCLREHKNGNFMIDRDGVEFLSFRYFGSRYRDECWSIYGHPRVWGSIVRGDDGVTFEYAKYGQPNRRLRGDLREAFLKFAMIVIMDYL